MSVGYLGLLSISMASLKASFPFAGPSTNVNMIMGSVSWKEVSCSQCYVTYTMIQIVAFKSNNMLKEKYLNRKQSAQTRYEASMQVLESQVGNVLYLQGCFS